MRELTERNLALPPNRSSVSLRLAKSANPLGWPGGRRARVGTEQARGSLGPRKPEAYATTGWWRCRDAPARAAEQFTFVFAVRWCSRGMSVPRRNGVLLGPLPRAVQGWSDITDLYVKKFGQPPPRSRVFIWTRQLVNGRKDALKRTCADVPPPERPGNPAPRQREGSR